MPKTGATRYQKFLKSEKAKTKLNKSKELPKGTNVTKTNFKVKKIVIKEQLKKHDQAEALSSRKLNLKELLVRLNHFNTNSRTEALNGIKELVTINPEILNRNLFTLINRVTPLIVNIEKVVRRDALQVLHLILSNISMEKLEAFFNYLSTYLRSAMTHIDNNIQEDSLLFLDILLLCAPKYVVKDFHKILPNFLDMISKLRLDSKPGRTLIVTLDSKNTSVKWRVKVLHRLQEFLNKFVNNDVIHEMKNVTRIYEENKCNYFSLFDQRYLSNSSRVCLPLDDTQNNIVNETEVFISYTDTLMPLLFETLIEVQPNENNVKTIENLLTEDAAILLKHILQVISLMVNHIKYLQSKSSTANVERNFYNKHRRQFSDHIVKGFPYHTNTKTRRAQQTATAQVFEDFISDQKMVMENLEICRLFIIFNPHINSKVQNKELTSIINYIEKIFNTNVDVTINKTMINILKSIFSNELTGWTKNIQETNLLFKKIVHAYLDRDKTNQFRQEHFCLLCTITLNEKLVHFHCTEAHAEWLKCIPNILLEPTISTESVNMLHQFSVCCNKTFNEIIKEKQVEIINNLPVIRITSHTNNVGDSMLYFKLYSTLFFYVKKWHSRALDVLQSQTLDHRYNDDHYKYIISMLNVRNNINNTQYNN